MSRVSVERIPPDLRIVDLLLAPTGIQIETTTAISRSPQLSPLDEVRGSRTPSDGMRPVHFASAASYRSASSPATRGANFIIPLKTPDASRDVFTLRLPSHGEQSGFRGGRGAATVAVKATNGAHNSAEWTPGNADALRCHVNSGDAFLFTLSHPPPPPPPPSFSSFLRLTCDPESSKRLRTRETVKRTTP